MPLLKMQGQVKKATSGRSLKSQILVFLQIKTFYIVFLWNINF